MIKPLIFLFLTLQLSSVATHSMKFFLTIITPGTSFPEFIAVGQTDEEQSGYYDSNLGGVILQADWLKKINDTKHWKMMNHIAVAEEEAFHLILAYLTKLFNQTEGVHTWQEIVGCELDDDGTKGGYMLSGYDGEDFLSIDLNSLKWTAATPQALPLKQNWEMKGLVNYVKYFLENECITWLRAYMEYGKFTRVNKVSVEVSLFRRNLSSPVVCHVTGFFPKAVMISWQKNGEDLHEDVELRETLPNQDGTFQKRSLLTVPPEDLRKNNYTCVVQHSSLKEEVQLSDHRVLSGDSDGGSASVTAGVVVTVVLLFIMSCAGVFMWRKQKSGFRPFSVKFNSDSLDPAPNPASAPCFDVAAAQL